MNAPLPQLTQPIGRDDPAFIRAATTPKRGIGAATLQVLGTYAGERHISLFEAAFVSMEDRLLASVVAGVEGIDDPLEALVAGAEVFLEECGKPDFRRIALEEAPGALGWGVWFGGPGRRAGGA